MKRTERINLSVRPEFKEGVKRLFSGDSLSNSYEKLVMVYLNKSITENKKMLDENIQALKLYREAGQGLESVEASIVSNINDLEKTLTKQVSIMKQIFPDKSIVQESELDFA